MTERTTSGGNSKSPGRRPLPVPLMLIILITLAMITTLVMIIPSPVQTKERYVMFEDGSHEFVRVELHSGLRGYRLQWMAVSDERILVEDLFGQVLLDGHFVLSDSLDHDSLDGQIILPVEGSQHSLLFVLPDTKQDEVKEALNLLKVFVE